MAETVGILNVAIQGKLDGLDRALRTAEVKAKTSGAKMEQSFGKFLTVALMSKGMDGLLKLVRTEFSAIDLITASIAGNSQRAAEQWDRLAAIAKDIPIVGDAFQVGQESAKSKFGKWFRGTVKDYALGTGLMSPDQWRNNIGDSTESARERDAADKREADRIEREGKERERQAKLAQSRVRELTRLAALSGELDPARRNLLQAGFDRDDRTTGIAGFSPQQQSAIKALADKLCC